jgi:glycosyltransferase involved in cell wall biosynthesis
VGKTGAGKTTFLNLLMRFCDPTKSEILLAWLREFVNDPNILRRYLSAADMYVLPSRHEGCPVALMEAMACSLPVVAAAATGVQDIVQSGEHPGGLVVARNDSGALATALGHLLDDELKRLEFGSCAPDNEQNPVFRSKPSADSFAIS